MVNYPNDASDNARGGRRGLRAIPTKDLFEAIRNAFNLRISNDVIDLGGSSNLNLLVTANNQNYVIRVYRPYVNKERLLDIQKVRRKLKEEGVPTTEAILTKDGQSYIVYNHRLVEMEPHIESDQEMNNWDRVKKGLPILGKIHTILKDIQVSNEAKYPLFANYIKPEDVRANSFKGIDRIRGWENLSDEEKKLADAAEELADLLYGKEIPLVSTLPRQLVHGDFWDNNIFFQQDQVVLVTDFDFMGERARIDDLALTLYFLSFQFKCMTTEESIARLSSLVQAYESGLGEPLSDTERKALPLALARQPLWSIGGWIVSLDDEETARNHANGMFSQVEWALKIMKDLDKWQEAFSS
ncbi:phosphotransferase enzyme family protein [Lederbergia wuyishanensis]|uniref:Homoserine kinase type II n=1 Tax=Lederbergia wuyishanensis TaxID=1347903 RepID=A0ABU0D6W4_9BACI|nr:phosphotransferase [Lederbergia wuyishanensis]MCJ8008794.1 phosphotransferase [Lederbergia wuyishanensis]MDQ0344115.1 homoserine kinase type II [Lederbergia wuyishanensis]